MNWSREPKVELHLHLEGAAPTALSRAEAARKGASLDRVIDPDGGYLWDDFGAFLAVYDRVADLYDTPEAESRLCEAVLMEAAAHGVIYAEMILSPDHAGPDPVRWAEHLDAVSEGAARAEAATGIVGRFISSGVRHFGVESVERAARLTVGAPHPRMVGFGLAGDERIHRPADFARAFDMAREAGLGLTAHAGEFAGPESVRGALDDLKVARLGHGVRAVEDAALVARLAGEGVVLDICPGSNVALGVYPSWAAHPIAALRDAGCRVTVSTDDPPFFHTDMTREYAELAGQGWDGAALRALALEAANAAFCDAATRDALLARLAAAPLAA